jgi:hypothetical protein
MDGKILIALQFWEGDKHQAMELADFLADIEPQHSDLADFLFMARYDCVAHQPTVNHVSRKFNVHSVVSRRRSVGWPAGCNDLWFSVMEWAQSLIQAKKIPHYKAIFTCEADGAPIQRDWIARLSLEWNRVNIPKPVVMAGAMCENGPHINGNALMSGDLNFLTWIGRRVGCCDARVGWDYCLAPDFRKRGWADIPSMKSIYGQPTFSQEQYDEFVKNGWTWVHGCKDNSLIKYGRARFQV